MPEPVRDTETPQLAPKESPQPVTPSRPLTVAESDRLFAERVEAAEAAKRAERLKLSPEASARVRKQRAGRTDDAGVAVDGASPRMLPGMAMIALFILVYALMNVFAAWRGAFGTGLMRYGLMGVLTMLVVGVFGLLKLRRWGWALVLGGSLFISFSYVLRFITLHAPLNQSGGLLVMAGFFMVFFLYLVRDEVRQSVY